MANINLLPWRDEYRQERKKEFLTTAVAVLVVALLCSYAWSSWVTSRIDRQDERNRMLRTEIAALDREVVEVLDLQRRREEVLERTEAIQALQGDRSDIVRIFDEFVRVVPDGVFFTTLERRSRRLTLQGFAESNNRVSTLMRQFDTSAVFTDPNLTRVVADTTMGEQGNRFNLLVGIAILTEAAELASPQ